MEPTGQHLSIRRERGVSRLNIGGGRRTLTFVFAQRPAPGGNSPLIASRKLISDERYDFGDVRVATLALLTRTALSG
jgi:hypothetical protein